MDAQRLSHLLGSSPQIINQHYYHGVASRDGAVFSGEGNLYKNLSMMQTKILLVKN